MAVASDLRELVPLPEEARAVRFVHPSERVVADILDFYGIPWEYEPTTFPLEWDEGGNVTASFTPDFYLPQLDTYIELTTMSQKLVTKKNRKVRRLRELYPEVHVRVLYRRDFQWLAAKYGLGVREADREGGLETASDPEP